MSSGRTIARQLMRLAPVRLYGSVMPREVIGFCYHVVSDQELPHVSSLYRYKNAAQFEADLVFLKRNFRVVSYPELIAARRNNRPVGRNAVFLSFDDGYAECYSVVRPILLEHRVPCTIFVTTDALDNARMLHFNKLSLAFSALSGMTPAMQDEALREFDREVGQRLREYSEFRAWLHEPGSADHSALDRLCAQVGVDAAVYLRDSRPYMTREQVRQLAADGFSIGGHTRTHPRLGSIGDSSLVEAEIVESCREARDLGGAKEEVAFAFPYNADGVDREFLRTLLDRHRWIGLMFGTGGMSRDTDFLINRMIADEPPRWGRKSTNLPTFFRERYLEEVWSPTTADGQMAGSAATR